MDPATGAVAAAGIQGTGNIVSTVLANKSSAKQQRLANAYNWMMWNAENEYNKPINQMKRFAEAGLNPNLIYGQGSAGNAGSAPAAVTAEKKYEIGEAFGNAFQTYIALKNLEAGLRKTDADLQKTDAETRALDAQTSQSFVNNAIRNQMMRAQIQSLKDKHMLNPQISERLDLQIQRADYENQLLELDLASRKKYGLSIRDNSPEARMLRLMTSSAGTDLGAKFIDKVDRWMHPRARGVTDADVVEFRRRQNHKERVDHALIGRWR